MTYIIKSITVDDKTVYWQGGEWTYNIDCAEKFISRILALSVVMWTGGEVMEVA